MPALASYCSAQCIDLIMLVVWAVPPISTGCGYSTPTETNPLTGHHWGPPHYWVSWRVHLTTWYHGGSTGLLSIMWVHPTTGYHGSPLHYWVSWGVYLTTEYHGGQPHYWLSWESTPLLGIMGGPPQYWVSWGSTRLLSNMEGPVNYWKSWGIHFNTEYYGGGGPPH